MKQVKGNQSNCIIWPPNMSTADEGKPCQIHRIEQSRLGIGGEFSIQAVITDGLLIVSECVTSIETQFPTDEDGNAVFSVPPHITFALKEVSRREQLADPGGFHLKLGDDD